MLKIQSHLSPVQVCNTCRLGESHGCISLQPSNNSKNSMGWMLGFRKREPFPGSCFQKFWFRNFNIMQFKQGDVFLRKNAIHSFENALLGGCHFSRIPQIGLMSVARFSWVPNLYNIHFLVENHRPQPDPVNSYRDYPHALNWRIAIVLDDTFGVCKCLQSQEGESARILKGQFQSREIFKRLIHLVRMVSKHFCQNWLGVAICYLQFEKNRRKKLGSCASPNWRSHKQHYNFPSTSRNLKFKWL